MVTVSTWAVAFVPILSLNISVCEGPVASVAGNVLLPIVNGMLAAVALKLALLIEIFAFGNLSLRTVISCVAELVTCADMDWMSLVRCANDSN